MRADSIRKYLRQLLMRREGAMCTTGISFQVMTNPIIREIVVRANLDFVHQQVIMVLYTLQHEKRLDQYAQVLPLYLGKDWSACERLLADLEAAGVVRRSSGGVDLPYEIHVDDDGDACACGM
ncbi:MAG: hypothetical protein ACP5M0_14020 [Desulfomonilaceae bacterium]